MPPAGFQGRYHGLAAARSRPAASYRSQQRPSTVPAAASMPAAALPSIISSAVCQETAVESARRRRWYPGTRDGG
jgi:hypothetical protein